MIQERYALVERVNFMNEVHFFNNKEFGKFYTAQLVDTGKWYCYKAQEAVTEPTTGHDPVLSASFLLLLDPRTATKISISMDSRRDSIAILA